jgi:hypothetical protein
MGYFCTIWQILSNRRWGYNGGYIAAKSSAAEFVPDVHNRRLSVVVQFSKKAENHAHMMAIYFMYYNFVRIHQTLKVTPAMGAGVSPKLWEMSDMVKVLEDWEALRTAV